MVARVGAQIALLAFAVAILAGLYAGNEPVTVLTRALLVMVAALLIGQGVAYTGRLVLTDHLRQKQRIQSGATERPTQPTGAPTRAGTAAGGRAEAART